MPAFRRRRTVFLTTLAVVALVVPLTALALGPPSGSGHAPAVADLLDQIPLGFEANQGQFDPDVRFAARAPGHTVLLTQEGLAISTPGTGGATVGIKLDGARKNAPIAGATPMTARHSQFFGSDPSRWRTDVQTYGSVSYREVYPGIDVVFYGRGRYVEHDFVVAPGADPADIRLALSGVSSTRLDGNGDLVLPAGTDEVRLRAPDLYQDVDGRRRPIEGRYERRPDGTVGFHVGSYDRSRPLVIDPVVVSASYLGGTSTETAYGVGVDVDGNIVIAGYTESSDFPTVSPTQSSLVQSEGARTDVFVTKVKADGTAVLWSTYLGGRGRDAAVGVAVGGDGTVYLTGYTESSDFPTARPFQNANAGGANDAFVAKLNSAGSALEYSSYLGGKGADTGSGIAVDTSGSAFVVGATGSSDFPTARPFQASLARPDDLDGFVAKIQPGGAGLVYSSYLGGAGDDHLTDVALDGEGNAHVVGDTRAGDFPTVRAFQAALGGGAGGSNFADAIVAKVRADGTGLVYGSFLGGTDSDKATAIALDAQSNAYVSGNTGSANFPVLSAFQSKKDGDFDAFVTKVKVDGNLAYSSFLGGSGSDGGEAVAVDRQGRAYVSGATASTNFPTEKAFQGAKGGGFVDAFISHVSANGQSLVSSSYLGGRDDDQSAGLAVDRDGNLAAVGYTNSADFPIARPFQAQKAGGVGDAFVVKIREDLTAGGSTPAASKQARRVRTLVTITGGLLIAAALQTLWLRRKPEPKGEPEPAPTGQQVEVPGLRYMPRRGKPAPTPTRSGGFAPSKPTKSADWDRRQPVGGKEELDEDEWEMARPRRRKSTPAWDEPQRPVLRPLERAADESGVPGVAVPDLWGSDAPLAEAAASVRGGRVSGDGVDREAEVLEDDVESERWPVETPMGGPGIGDLDPMDVWGPLVVEQDPEQWADEWGVTGLLKTDEGAAPPVETALAAAADAAARAEREAAEAASLAAAAERAAVEAAVAEATARKAAELAEREAAELAAQDAAEVWGPGVGDRVEAPAREVVAEREAREPAAGVVAEAQEAGEREAAERAATERAAAEREEAERAAAERQALEQAAAEQAAVEREAAERAAAEAAEREAREARERAEAEEAELRAAAERAALHEAVRRATEREALAMRAGGTEGATASPVPTQQGPAGQERDEAERAALQAAELESIAQSRADAARAAQAARLAAQAEAADATRRAEAAQAEARAAAQAAALQAALAAFEAAEAEAARIAEADAARLAAQVAAQVAEAHAARIASQAAAAAQAESEARARAEARLEAERQAAEAAEAAARAQAEADARAAAAASAAAEAELQVEVPPAPSEVDVGARRAAWSEAVADAEAWAEEARLAEVQAAEAAAAAEAAERAEREAAEAAEQAEREAAEARAAEARTAERQARQNRSPEERAAEREAAAARAAEARAAETRAAEARAAQVRAAEARAAEARAAQTRAAEARAAQARAAEARAAQGRAAAPQPTPVGGPPRPDRPAAGPPARTQEPAGRPQPAVAGHRDLSLSELLDEDLPIPEPVGAPQQPHWDQRRLDQVLDEDVPAPPPLAPPPNPSGLVGGATGPGGQDDEGEEEGEDFLPPPPPHLRTNLFEPDPDDPLVQSTRSGRDQGRRER